MNRRTEDRRQTKIPEIPQTNKKTQHQNPIALCRSQLNRGKRASHLILVLHRQCLIPGHQRMAPVKESSVRRQEAMPFTRRPVFPPKRLLCKSVSHAKMCSITV